nr:glycosyltransferase family 2 protein [Paracoccus sp. S-4012]
MTCERYLDDRAAAVRKSYVTRLQELGIPYVFVVGGGDGAQAGDVVRLDCPDDYEHLPQKTLKAVEWVHRNTPHAFMLKIDDDCFLNVDEFLFSRSYRKFDYYGRRIHRPIGGMDRTWHMAKSSSARGRMELDKSPEPSVYADGGSGYSLSRRAMGAILDAVSSPEGSELVRESFMEDKMVGDLLRLRGIGLHSEDLYVSVLRKAAGSRVPVSMYKNAFFSSDASPAKVVHIDGSALQEAVGATLHRPVLEPKKIWPTWTPVAVGADSNALELVSSRATCERLARAPLAVVACVRNEMFMLPSFLAHYRKLGVESFLISDNCSTDGTLDYLLEQPDVVVFSCDTQYRKSVYGVAWQQAMLANFRMGRWSIVVDADELLVHPDSDRQSLAEFLAAVDAEGADSVTCLMLDMYPRGLLENASFEGENPFEVAAYADRKPFRRTWIGHGPYFNSLTWTSALRHRLMPNSKPDEFVAQKACILKYAPWMQLSAGIHYVGDRRASRSMAILAHFKYHAAFKGKVVAEVERGQHFGDAAEYQRYLSLLAEGRDTLFDEAVSVPWDEAEMVREILHTEQPRLRTSKVRRTRSR